MTGGFPINFLNTIKAVPEALGGGVAKKT